MTTPAPPNQTVKAIVSGTLPNNEIFAFGFQLDGSGITGQLSLTNLLGVVSASLTNNFLTTGVKALFPSSVTFTTVSLYYYTGGSTAALQAQNAGINTAGTSGSNALPNQCALVVTLQTGVPGRTKRGRSYLPTLAVNAITANGQLTSPTCTLIANAFAAFLEGIKTATNGAQPVVASARSSAKTNITSVRVDSLIDTQRRRRNKSLPQASIVSAVA